MAFFKSGGEGETRPQQPAEKEVIKRVEKSDQERLGERFKEATQETEKEKNRLHGVLEKMRKAIDLVSAKLSTLPRRKTGQFESHQEPTEADQERKIQEKKFEALLESGFQIEADTKKAEAFLGEIRGYEKVLTEKGVDLRATKQELKQEMDKRKSKLVDLDHKLQKEKMQGKEGLATAMEITDVLALYLADQAQVSAIESAGWTQQNDEDWIPTNGKVEIPAFLETFRTAYEYSDKIDARRFAFLAK